MGVSPFSSKLVIRRERDDRGTKLFRVFSYSRREGSPKARNALLFVIVVMFAISSFEFWTDVIVILTGIKNVFVDNIECSFIDKQAAYGERFSPVVSVQEALGPLEVSAVFITASNY